MATLPDETLWNMYRVQDTAVGLGEQNGQVSYSHGNPPVGKRP